MVITSRKTILIGSYIRLQLFSFSLVCSHKRFPYNRILDIPERRQFQKKSQQLFPGCSPLWCLPAQSSPSQQEKKKTLRIKQSYIEPKPFTNTADHLWDELLVPNSPLCTPHSQPWQDPSVFLVSSYRCLYSSWPGCLSLESTLYCSSLCNYTPRSSATKSKESQQKKKRKQSYVVDSPFEKTVMRATWFKESAPVRSVLSWPLKCSYKQEPSGVYRET